jgi:hypothetical protein
MPSIMYRMIFLTCKGCREMLAEVAVEIKDPKTKQAIHHAIHALNAVIEETKSVNI